MSKLVVLADGALGLSVLFLSPWLYEFGNWASLTVVGAHPLLLWSGVFPSGVVTLSRGYSGFPEAKLLQIATCAGLTLAASILTRRKGLQITSLALVSALGLFLASAYWESFSLATLTSPMGHEATFYALSVIMTFGLLRTFPRERQSRGYT